MNDKTKTVLASATTLYWQAYERQKEIIHDAFGVVYEDITGAPMPTAMSERIFRDIEP